MFGTNERSFVTRRVTSVPLITSTTPSRQVPKPRAKMARRNVATRNIRDFPESGYSRRQYTTTTSSSARQPRIDIGRDDFELGGLDDIGDDVIHESRSQTSRSRPGSSNREYSKTTEYSTRSSSGDGMVPIHIDPGITSSRVSSQPGKRTYRKEVRTTTSSGGGHGDGFEMSGRPGGEYHSEIRTSTSSNPRSASGHNHSRGSHSSSYGEIPISVEGSRNHDLHSRGGTERSGSQRRTTSVPRRYEDPFDRGDESNHNRRGKEKKFLREVQDELENRRADWSGEVEKMIKGLSIQKLVGEGHIDGPSVEQGGPAKPNGFMEQTDTGPVYKAFVDVKEYPPTGISVTIDNLENKLVVKAQKEKGPGNLTRTFTQKVALPRYSDHQRIRTKLTKGGILTVEVPLLFYFEPEKRKAKSFVHQIKPTSDGNKTLEIMVNIGAGVNPWEIKIRVNERDELLVHTEKEMMLSDGTVTKKRTLVKRYILPQHADVQGIRSNLGADGRLEVTVPLISDHIDNEGQYSDD